MEADASTTGRLDVCWQEGTFDQKLKSNTNTTRLCTRQLENMEPPEKWSEGKKHEATKDKET